MDEFFKGECSKIFEELLPVLVWCGRVGHGWVAFQRLFRLHLFKPQFCAHGLQKSLPFTAVQQDQGCAVIIVHVRLLVLDAPVIGHRDVADAVQLFEMAGVAGGAKAGVLQKRLHECVLGKDAFVRLIIGEFQ